MTRQGSQAAPDPIDLEVGLPIRRLRTNKSMSQDQLGRALGITFQQIQKYERGTNRISASMLVRAAKALDVQPADLLPTTDAERLPPVAQHLSIRGAEELLHHYAAITAPSLRRAVLKLVGALRDAASMSRDGEQE